MTNVEAKLEGGYKVCITGEYGVGKTALMTRFADGTFDEKAKSSIGVDFRVVDVPLEGSLVKLKVTGTL